MGLSYYERSNLMSCRYSVTVLSYNVYWIEMWIIPCVRLHLGFGCHTHTASSSFVVVVILRAHFSDRYVFSWWLCSCGMRVYSPWWRFLQNCDIDAYTDSGLFFLCLLVLLTTWLCSDTWLGSLPNCCRLSKWVNVVCPWCMTEYVCRLKFL